MVYYSTTAVNKSRGKHEKTPETNRFRVFIFLKLLQLLGCVNVLLEVNEECLIVLELSAFELILGVVVGVNAGQRLGLEGCVLIEDNGNDGHFLHEQLLCLVKQGRSCVCLLGEVDAVLVINGANAVKHCLEGFLRLVHHKRAVILSGDGIVVGQVVDRLDESIVLFAVVAGQVGDHIELIVDHTGEVECEGGEHRVSICGVSTVKRAFPATTCAFSSAFGQFSAEANRGNTMAITAKINSFFIAL